MSGKIEKSDSEWREALTPEQYRVLREKGTERAFTGKYEGFKGEGKFLCAACGQPVFDSEEKYESGSGWPSFTAPDEQQSVEEHRDKSHGMERVEVVCSRCEGHLGHVFPDGPGADGNRYCINSAALEFTPREDETSGAGDD